MNRGFYLILLGALLLSAGVKAQKTKFNKTFRSDILLPVPVANRAFTSVFSGVYYANASYNIEKKGFVSGVFISNMQSMIYPKLQSEPHSIQTLNSAGLRFGYDFKPSKEELADIDNNFWVTSPFIMAGYTMVNYSRLKCITQTVQNKTDNTFSVNLGTSFTLMFSEYDGIGFTIGYGYLHHEFNPNDLCLNEWWDFEPKDTKGPNQYIFFGFNFNIWLGNREGSSN